MSANDSSITFWFEDDITQIRHLFTNEEWADIIRKNDD